MEDSPAPFVQFGTLGVHYDYDVIQQMNTAARLPTAGGELLHVPSVLAVKRFVNAPRDVGWSRSGVLKRDEYTCIYCGQHLARRECNGRKANR